MPLTIDNTSFGSEYQVGGWRTIWADAIGDTTSVFGLSQFFGYYEIVHSIQGKHSGDGEIEWARGSNTQLIFALYDQGDTPYFMERHYYIEADTGSTTINQAAQTSQQVVHCFSYRPIVNLRGAIR